MHDAVTLSNWICSLQTKDIDDIVKIFKEYKAERYPVVKAAFETSRMLRNVMGKVCLPFVSSSLSVARALLVEYVLSTTL